MPKRVLPFFFCLIFHAAWAQKDSSNLFPKPGEKDLIDVVDKILNKQVIKLDTAKKEAGRIYFSGSPAFGYSLSTGWASLIVGNGAFYTNIDKAAKLSNVYFDAVYTQHNQTLVLLQSNIWTKKNRFNIVNDWRYYNYPQRTYGLGG